ncbi:Serine/threonine-protein kinase ppk15 [Choanephora cucurbitarum]|uniref:Serine/threonine-protein kinase ppk15 n=1 Tax=Choanephora cucurbitarum TaxID=101091 RepID=A0A1C7N5Z3_9FUNG|nr:Serine/threonine-protein kinase ppk15 [Choanephora cucurbitarum]
MQSIETVIQKTTLDTKRDIPNRLVIRATVDYLNVIQKRNPYFRTERVFIPRRTLTNPRAPSKNHGFDNINDDYILRVKEVLGDVVRYEILDLMGQGTFGQVVKCKTQKTGEFVAIKVIKKQHAYQMQSLKEIQVLNRLKSRPEHKHRFLQLHNSFMFRGHVCAVFELLSISIHKLFSQQTERPRMSIRGIQKVASNVLETLALLKEMRIIHTDLKPDNILLKSSDDIHDVKLIDYGSAFFETDPLNYCIQTAFYRSPEVILRHPFGCAVDMWSFGCFVAELFLGKPLFPTGHELALLHMMVATLNRLPPEHMLKSKKAHHYFHLKQPISLRPLRDMPKRQSLEEQIIKADTTATLQERKSLIDFLVHILVFDPIQRYTPKQALNHAFLAGTIGIPPTKPLKSILKTKQ